MPIKFPHSPIPPSDLFAWTNITRFITEQGDDIADATTPINWIPAPQQLHEGDSTFPQTCVLTFPYSGNRPGVDYVWNFSFWVVMGIDGPPPAVVQYGFTAPSVAMTSNGIYTCAVYDLDGGPTGGDTPAVLLSLINLDDIFSPIDPTSGTFFTVDGAPLVYSPGSLNVPTNNTSPTISAVEAVGSYSFAYWLTTLADPNQVDPGQLPASGSPPPSPIPVFYKATRFTLIFPPNQSPRAKACYHSVPSGILKSVSVSPTSVPASELVRGTVTLKNTLSFDIWVRVATSVINPDGIPGPPSPYASADREYLKVPANSLAADFEIRTKKVAPVSGPQDVPVYAGAGGTIVVAKLIVDE